MVVVEVAIDGAGLDVWVRASADIGVGVGALVLRLWVDPAAVHSRRRQKRSIST